MKFLVTGGAGFIGSNITEALVEKGEEVRVIDNLSTGKKENLEPFLDKIEFIEGPEGDLCDIEVAKKAVEGVGYIFHEAALPSVPRSVRDPISSNNANVSGTLNLLCAARDAGVKRLVYASSSSVYGESPVLPKKEDMSSEPLSPYAVSKLAGELYCKAFYRVYGLETVSLRYFNVFGPRQDPSSQYAAVIPKFIKAMLKKENPFIYGDGTQTRDFTYVENVVNANLLAIESRDAVGKVFNISYGSSRSINQLVKSLNKILGENIKSKYEKERPGDIMYSRGDISSAENILGYRPKVSLEEGLKKTVDWFSK